MDNLWARQLGHCTIKTNISDSFFYDEEDEDKFYDYVNKSIPYVDDYIVDNVPSDIISQLTLIVNGFNEDHTLDVLIECDVELSEEDYDLLGNDTELIRFIEYTVIPEYIAWFNSLDNSIIFPVNRDRDNDKFRRLKFDGIDFYIRLFGPDKEDPNYRAYTDVSIKTDNLQLVNDYDVEVFE
jgi:hypothetical protein